MLRVDIWYIYLIVTKTSSCTTYISCNVPWLFLDWTVFYYMGYHLTDEAKTLLGALLFNMPGFTTIRTDSIYIWLIRSNRDGGFIFLLVLFCLVSPLSLLFVLRIMIRASIPSRFIYAGSHPLILLSYSLLQLLSILLRSLSLFSNCPLRILVLLRPSGWISPLVRLWGLEKLSRICPCGGPWNPKAGAYCCGGPN